MAAKPESVEPECTGLYEWVLPNFASCRQKFMESKVFRLGGYAWKLLYVTGPPRVRAPAGVSLHMCDWDARTPHPAVRMGVTIVNHKDARNGTPQFAQGTYTTAYSDYAYVLFESPAQAFDKLTTDSGFLRGDGALVVRVGIRVSNPRPPKPLWSDLGCPGLAGDLLALLDNDPGATSDLTIIAGGGESIARTSGGSSSSMPYVCPQRSFRVHRAVLAARCPFFRTLFNADMADSAARELPLPDADPDAFAVLLRYLYGGEVPHCERAVHRAAITLCDSLLMFGLEGALEAKLVLSANEETIAADLLWAAAGHAREVVLEELVAVYKRVARDVDVCDTAALAMANPQLAGHIIAELSAGAKGAMATLAVANPPLAGRLLVDLARQQQHQLPGELRPVGQLRTVMTNRHRT